jgi:excisionase family DNA binding protein
MSHLLLTVPETAAELRVHRDTVYALISDGRLKAHNLAKPGARSKTRIHRDDLNTFIASCATTKGEVA